MAAQISDYYVGKFADGRRQFESHKTVNPNDVENAAWHFLCVARLDGIEKAQSACIKIDTTRTRAFPWPRFTNSSPDAVPRRPSWKRPRRPRTSAGCTPTSIWAFTTKRPATARRRHDHIRRAAAANVRQDYMHDVAEIHLQRRNWAPAR